MRPGGLRASGSDEASWHAWLFAGFLPLSLLGFGASAVADRPVFLLWWAVAIIAHAVAVRRSFRARPLAPSRARGLPLVTLGGSLVLLGALSWIYRGDLGEGIAAFMPVGGG